MFLIFLIAGYGRDDFSWVTGTLGIISELKYQSSMGYMGYARLRVMGLPCSGEGHILVARQMCISPEQGERDMGRDSASIHMAHCSQNIGDHYF